MLHHRRIPFLLLATFCITTFASGAALGDVDIVVESVKVRQTKEGGDAWDGGGGRPDLRVIITRESEPKGETYMTAAAENRLEAEFHRRGLQAKDGDMFEIEVVDVDLRSHDSIGKKSIRVDRRMIKNGRIDLSFGQVIQLKLRLQP